MEFERGTLVKNGISYSGVICGGGGASTASNVTFDNTGTDIESNNVQDAIEEVFLSASNGKKSIAGAITGKGVPTEDTDTFSQMAANIGEIGKKVPSLGTRVCDLYTSTSFFSTETFTFDIPIGLNKMMLYIYTRYATITMTLNGESVPVVLTPATDFFPNISFGCYSIEASNGGQIVFTATPNSTVGQFAEFKIFSMQGGV